MKYVRTTLAIVFLALLALLLVWSVRKDFESKMFERVIELPPPVSRFNNYILNLNSFDTDSQSVKGTLSLKAGWPLGIKKRPNIFYWHLSYADLTYQYAVSRSYIDISIISIRDPIVRASTFSKSLPTPIDFSIQAIGTPEIYPFDNYFIMGAVACPAYIQQGKKKEYFHREEYIHTMEEGETLSIKNSMKGFFVRFPTNTEIDGVRIKSVSGDQKEPPTTNGQAKELNNERNRFALILERPLYLKIMTLVLGIIALISALYIGFITPFKDIPLPIIGYIIGLWGIRNILLGDLKIFPTYLDYIVLAMYLLVFAGIIFRKIKG